MGLVRNLESKMMDVLALFLVLAVKYGTAMMMICVQYVIKHLVFCLDAWWVDYGRRYQLRRGFHLMSQA